MRALVIDDSRTMRSLLSRQLAALGYETLQAANGQEALEVLEAAGDDLPVLATIDWNMPVMDGLTFVQRVRPRAEWRGITLMMVTTEAEYEQIVRALAAGAHEYLIKPFTPEAFIDKLHLLGLVPERGHLMTTTLELELEDIRVVTNDVWSSFLATYGPLEWAGTPLEATELVQASVEIHGDWDGTVTLEMTPETAETAARTMLSLDVVEEADITDALGELVNMIGGNIKCLLPPGAVLGLPSVHHAPLRQLGSGDTTEHYRVELSWAGTPIRIRVWSDVAN